jgi:hypothetical protein
MAMTKLVTTNQAKPPAERKPWPTQAEVQKLADRLDCLVKHNAWFQKALDGDLRYKRLEDLQGTVDWFEASGAKKLAERLAAEDGNRSLEPAEWCDENGNVQQNAVSVLLAQLVGSFPTSNLPDAKTFTRVLLDDVMALEPSYVALESACRKLRRTQKFLPSISEVIAAIEKEQDAWCDRWEAANFILGGYEDVLERIEEKKLDDEKRAKEAAERAAEQEKRAKEAAEREAERKAWLALPIAVGDIVWHNMYGRGTVKAIEEVAFVHVKRAIVLFEKLFEGSTGLFEEFEDDVLFEGSLQMRRIWTSFLVKVEPAPG